MSALNSIVLRHVIPDIFKDGNSNQPTPESEVWMEEVVFKRGEFYMIQAESGTGKSSLCSFIYGNRGDYSGEILFDGTDIRTFDVDEWCRRRTNSLALLPQEMRIFPELTALENIQIKNRLTNFKTDKEILEMLERLELSDKTDTKASKMSVGQQQRVAIIRTLCQPMDFLLLDEPVSHLDTRNNASVAELIREEASRQGAGIIATSVGYDISLDFNRYLLL